MTVEEFAMMLHDAGKNAVDRGLVVNKPVRPFLAWDEISEDAKEGRRVQARYILERCEVVLK